MLIQALNNRLHFSAGAIEIDPESLVHCHTPALQPARNYYSQAALWQQLGVYTNTLASRQFKNGKLKTDLRFFLLCHWQSGEEVKINIS